MYKFEIDAEYNRNKFDNFSEKAKRKEYLKELRHYRKINEHVKEWEKLYYNMFNLTLNTMSSLEINDLLIFILNTMITQENVSKNKGYITCSRSY